MSDILTKIRKLNWLFQESPTGAFSFKGMCAILSDLMDANVYVANTRGKIIGVSYKIKSDSSAITDPETGNEVFPGDYNEEFMNLKETMANLKGDKVLEIFKYDYDTSDKLHTLIPIIGGGARLGTMIMARYEPEFTDEDLALAEYGATIVGLEIQRRKTMEEEEETLSYSEIEAVQRIFEELEGEEGLLVASKIADKSGITRSVIVNALRKLESAGVIESRSLGMKGTRIKITNPKFQAELQKMAF